MDKPLYHEYQITLYNINKRYIIKARNVEEAIQKLEERLGDTIIIEGIKMYRQVAR